MLCQWRRILLVGITPHTWPPPATATGCRCGHGDEEVLGRHQQASIGLCCCLHLLPLPLFGRLPSDFLPLHVMRMHFLVASTLLLPATTVCCWWLSVSNQMPTILERSGAWRPPARISWLLAERQSGIPSPPVRYNFALPPGAHWAFHGIPWLGRLLHGNTTAASHWCRLSQGLPLDTTGGCPPPWRTIFIMLAVFLGHS